jgi:glycosyltransferase involved in cell wall biosynthesis
VGDGPQRRALEAKSVALGVSSDVVFTGFCATPEKLLPGFAIAAISSDTEQMPRAVLEAMAAGRPVAATDVGDITDMLAPENRPFVVERTPERLADAISRLLHAPDRAAIGSANRQRAEQEFDQRRMFTAYGSLFDQVSDSKAITATACERTLGSSKIYEK